MSWLILPSRLWHRLVRSLIYVPFPRRFLNGPPPRGGRSHSQTDRPMPTQPTLVVVEGRHDISFLRIISSMLHASQSDVPDLAAMERQGRVFGSCWCEPALVKLLFGS